ncbi:Tyrosine kinase domain protein [Ceratobasidium sp. AG-Ba]|nr:Tyrosine kinase domain protein [Ceratobasidium sp. AG-Ba]
MSRKVAIKCPRLFYTQEALAGETARNIAREVYTWSKLHHPNIQELVGIAIFKEQLSIVAPWQENGTLTSYIKKHPDAERFQLCVQVSSGLAYLHKSGTVHGDVKGENILVSEEGTAKLTDFGNTLLKKYTIEFTGKGDASPLSMRWSAPELLEGSPPAEKADIYALGMTFLQIVTGEVPFSELGKDVAVMLAIMKSKTPRRPESLDQIPARKGEVLWETINKCWRLDASERPSADEVEREQRLRSAREAYDRGSQATLSQYTDQKIAAVMIKKSPRELPEPIFSGELYPVIVRHSPIRAVALRPRFQPDPVALVIPIAPIVPDVPVAPTAPITSEAADLLVRASLPQAKPVFSAPARAPLPCVVSYDVEKGPELAVEKRILAQDPIIPVAIAAVGAVSAVGAVFRAGSGVPRKDTVPAPPVVSFEPPSREKEKPKPYASSKVK